MILTTNLTEYPHLSGTQLALFQHSLFVDTTSSERRYVVPISSFKLIAASCSPPTPISDLENYTSDVKSWVSAISQIVNGLGTRSLLMGDLARANDELVDYLHSLPSEFCIDPSNQDAFEALNRAIDDANNQITRGTTIFENNFQAYVDQVVPLLNYVYNECNKVDSSSRDFTGVIDAVSRYNSFASGYSIDIWYLSQRIKQLATSLESDISEVELALQNAIEQIEVNVESEAKTFVSRQTASEAALHEWEHKNGKTGFNKFHEIIRNMKLILVPAFNAFRQRVPDTHRIDNAVQLAQRAVNQIEIGFRTFPTFLPLPAADSSKFPYLRYGSDERKFGQNQIIKVLQSACVAHFKDTGKEFYIGDMQWEHGGKISGHTSHKKGIDADVDPVEVGNVPNNNKILALAVAKRFLSAGAQLVLYADQSVVNDANKWATKKGISGKLLTDGEHDKHFHLRV